MREQTQRRIDEVAGAEWCARVGEAMDGTGFKTVSTWSEARQAAASQRWHHANTEFQNLLAKEVWTRDEELFNDSWNEYVLELNGVIEPLLNEQLGRHDLESKLTPQLVRGLRGIIRLGCVQYEFFGHELSPWHTWLVGLIIDGHLPCGWQGGYAKEPIYEHGTLVVF